MKRDVATNKVGEVHKKILSNYLKSQALNEASGSKGRLVSIAF